MLCSYGCGKEANYEFKNGKWCCCKSQNSCQRIREKFKKKRLVRKPHSEESKMKISRSNKGRVPWNKGRKGIYTEETLKKMRKPKKNKSKRKREVSEETKKKIRKRLKGKSHVQTKETKEKISRKNKGKKLGPQSEEHRENISKANKGIKKHTESHKKNLRQVMKDGQAAFMLSKNRNPSIPQVIIFKMNFLLLPSPVLNYPFYRGKGKRSYSLDVADSRLPIVIEYDGSRYHQDKEKDDRRQKEIEEDGWIFLRYEKIPTIEQLRNDINGALEGG